MATLPNKRVLKRQLKKLESVKAALDKTLGDDISVSTIARVKGAIVALDTLKSHNLISLAEAADEVYFGSFYEGYSASAYMRFSWNRQTEARHIYGGVFPESWVRLLFLEGDTLVRAYRLGENLCDFTIKFTRPAVYGEKIGNCTVKREYRELLSADSYYHSYYQSRVGRLLLYCPTKGGW